MCKYNKNGNCTATIAVNCMDDCIIKELQAEIKAHEKTIEEAKQMYVALSKQYKKLKKEYDFVVRQYQFVVERKDELEEIKRG